MRACLLTLALTLPCYAIGATDTEFPDDVIEKARNLCVNWQGPDVSACRKQWLDEWLVSATPPTEQNLSRLTVEIATGCVQPDTDKFKDCADSHAATFPDFLRQLVTARAFRVHMEQLERTAALEREKIAAACRRSGLKEGIVRIGMTARQVRECGWGVPLSVNRTITARSIREQWVYGTGQYLYIDDGRLTAIQD